MGAQTKRISAAAYQALVDALPVIVWYRPCFARYVRAALREHPELYAGIDFAHIPKREAADEIVSRLMLNERTYQDVTLRFMLEIASTTEFPELQKHEDRDKLLAQARSAVAHLKRQTADYAAHMAQQERLNAERAAYEKQAQVLRRFSDELNDLRSEFLRMFGMPDGQAQQRGRDFEPFLNRLFGLFDLEPRLSYSLEREQIDGAFTFDTDDYIIEAKWRKEKVSRAEADSFDKKVERKGKNALGLFVSIEGFSGDAISEYSQRTKFMTMDGSDIMAVLTNQFRLEDVLRRKKRHANETGECYFPVNRF